MASIEAEARAAGKAFATLLSTVMAVRFYSRLGYAVERPLTLSIAGAIAGPIADGRLIEVFAMTKTLSACSTAASNSLAAAAETGQQPHLARAA